MGTAASSGTFHIGGTLAVRRMAYGSMQLAGPGVWGPPQNEANAHAVLRRAAQLGINFIDTADVYGPDHVERIIREALHPYAADMVIATKAGLVRSGPATREKPGISMNGSAAHIRRALERSLRNLGLERIDLYQLHRVDPAIPIEETMEVFRALRQEGKIRYIGLSEVSVQDIERARAVVDIATVQNVYNLSHRKHDDVLAYCERAGIGFIPFWPLHSGALAKSQAMATILARTGATAAQVALAWLLQKSPAIILIPGTASLSHLEENVGASNLELSPAERRALEQFQPAQGHA